MRCPLPLVFTGCLLAMQVAIVFAGQPPSYTVTRVATVPADDAAWAALPALTLAQSTNGAAPDLATRVRIVHCSTNLFVRFEAEEPIAPMIVDRLAIFVKGAITNPPVFFVNGEGGFPNKLPQKLAGYTYSNGLWAVVLKCQAAALGITPGQAKTVEIQIERRHGARKNTPATEAYWAPPTSFGRVEVMPPSMAVDSNR